MDLTEGGGGTSAWNSRTTYLATCSSSASVTPSLARFFPACTSAELCLSLERDLDRGFCCFQLSSILNYPFKKKFMLTVLEYNRTVIIH